MSYTVAYIKNGEDYAYEYYKDDVTLSEIIDIITYEMNRYGKECDAVDIYSVNDNEIDFYYKVVNDDGMYKLKLVEW